MRFFNDITKMSLNGLLSMHRATHDRLVEEDNLPAKAEKVYGVREHPDWKMQADEMEAELDRRKATYTKIRW